MAWNPWKGHDFHERRLLVLAAFLSGCSVTTSLDGIFDEGVDATIDDGTTSDTGDEDGSPSFPTEGGASTDDADAVVDTGTPPPPPWGGAGQLCCAGGGCGGGSPSRRTAQPRARPTARPATAAARKTRCGGLQPLIGSASLVRDLRAAGWTIHLILEHEITKRTATVRLLTREGLNVDLLTASSGIEPEIVDSAPMVAVRGVGDIRVARAEEASCANV